MFAITSSQAQLTLLQCDEGHPTCRNCVKSKRECLGYDPIFKLQPGVAPIQPAPAGADTQSSKSTSSSTTLPPNTYQPPQTFPDTGGAFVPATNPSQSLDGTFEYSASLDPALATGDQSHTMAANNYSTTLQSIREGKQDPCSDLDTRAYDNQQKSQSTSTNSSL